MACEITITSVNVYGNPGQPIDLVRVQGTAKNCANVVVVISCGGPLLKKVFSVNAQDIPVSWSVEFSELGGSGCVCGSGNMRVAAYCKEDEACGSLWPTLSPPECQPYEPVCPELGEITTSPQQDCYAPGDPLKLSVSVTDPGNCISLYYWIFSEQPSPCSQEPGCTGGLQPAITRSTTVPSLALTLAMADGFAEGNWTVQVFAIPTNCENCSPVASPPLPFSILQPSTCPQVSSLDEPVLVSTTSAGFEYQFTAHLAGNTEDASVQWNFGSGLTDPVCLCGANSSETTHIFPKEQCGENVTVRVLLDPGNGCCSLMEEEVNVQLPACEGGGGDGDEHPCPWWNPFCKGWSLCAGLLAAIMAAILTAGISLAVGNCLNVPTLTGVGYAAAALSLILLSLWYWLCSKTQPDFCDTLAQLILFLAYVIAVQGIILAVIAVIFEITLLEIILCSAVSWLYYGMVMAYLVIIQDQTC